MWMMFNETLLAPQPWNLSRKESFLRFRLGWGCFGLEAAWRSLYNWIWGS